MRIIIAPDSFKGTISATDAASSIADGWRSVRPDDDLVLLPQADGGEGTLDAIEAATPGSVRHHVGDVTGPDGRPTPGEWLELPGSAAVVELAQMSGLPLMERPDALRASTRGLGEVIRSAIDHGARSLMIGLGGSASTDGGTAALAALGLELLDEQGELVRDGGGYLRDIVGMNPVNLVPAPQLTLLTDVSSPLLGPTGSAAVFAPQKGASPAQVAELDAGLAHLAELLGGDPAAPGAGAAGGTAFGFSTLWNARIESGAGHIATLTGLDEAVKGADVVLTGEGSFDTQSRAGKVVGTILGMHERVCVIAGVVAAPTDWAISLAELAGSTAAARTEPAHWLRVAGAGAARAV